MRLLQACAATRRARAPPSSRVAARRRSSRRTRARARAPGSGTASAPAPCRPVPAGCASRAARSLQHPQEELEEALRVEVLDERAVRLVPGDPENVDRRIAACQLTLRLDVDEHLTRRADERRLDDGRG